MYTNLSFVLDVAANNEITSRGFLSSSNSEHLYSHKKAGPVEKCRPPHIHPELPRHHCWHKKVV